MTLIDYSSTLIAANFGSTEYDYVQIGDDKNLFGYLDNVQVWKGALNMTDLIFYTGIVPYLRGLNSINPPFSYVPETLPQGDADGDGFGDRCDYCPSRMIDPAIPPRTQDQYCHLVFRAEFDEPDPSYDSSGNGGKFVVSCDAVF
jgi:hypothetical protein